ncbi:hypothetical protein FB451DRAFT_1563285 [Mycena latifolia]|nr:hypothetical protein FB451DRAFT_1563285 [Mycena latifolia]
MRHGRIVPLSGPLLRATSEGSGCPPTDLDGTSLLDGDTNGPLTLCLYSVPGIPCTFLGEELQANLSGNSTSCPASLISGSEGGGTDTLSDSATTVASTISESEGGGTDTLSDSATTVAPTISVSTSSVITPVSSTIQRSTSNFGGDSSAILTSATVSSIAASLTATPSGPSSSPPTSEQTNPPTVAAARNPSLPGREIAGIVVGTVALLFLAIALLFFTGRRRKRVLDPVVHLELATGSDPMFLPMASEKTTGLEARFNGTGYRQDASSIRSPVAEISQEHLRTEIGAGHRRLITMNGAVSPSSADDEGDEERTLQGAMREIQAQQQRIGMLESELHSQWAHGLADQPPPGYSQ